MNSRIRVMHVVNRLVMAGLETMVTSLILNMKDFEQMICVEVKFRVQQASLEDRLRSEGVRIFHMNRLEDQPQRMLPLNYMRLFQREQVDIVHTHSGVWRDAFIGGKLAGVPIHLHTEHGMPVNGSGTKERLTYQFLSRYSDQLISVSDDLRNYLVSELQLNPAKVSVIRNGIDTAKFRPSIGLNGIRKECGISPHEKILATVGRIVPIKDHGTLLHGFSLVLKEAPHCRLVIVGREETNRPGVAKAIQNLAVELGIQDRVHFLGERNDIHDLLNQLDIFILSSLSEGTSIALLEASASGIPVVATSVGGTPQIVEDGKTGFLIPAGNPEALADRVLRLLANEGLARSMGAAGRELVQREFGLQGMADEYRQLYSRLVAEKITPRQQP